MNESEQREGWVLLMQKFVFKEVNDKSKVFIYHEIIDSTPEKVGYRRSVCRIKIVDSFEIVV